MKAPSGSLKYSVVALAVATVLIAARPAFSHLADRTAAGGVVARDRWAAQPVRWTLNPQTSANIQDTLTRSVGIVIQSSFDTWTSAPDAALSLSRQPDTSQTSFGNDGVNLICFVCNDPQRAVFSGSETLAVTLTTTSTSAGSVGQLLDADILFNPAVNFSTVGAGGVQDLQTVATHEIGHFFGLSHSGVVRAMMFPFAPSTQHTLSYDDVAGISALYPSNAPAVPTTTISGTVRLNNAGVFGAHVYAESQTALEPFSAFNIRKSPISTLSLPDGTYVIEGVPADSYRVTAEPLDKPVTNADVSDFANVFGQSSVQTNFTTRWH
jgi:hypothetical protein